VINVIYPNFHYPCDRLAFFKAAYHMFDAEFYVKADDDIYLRPGKVRGYVLQFLKSIIWLLFILLRQIDLLLFLQKKDLSTGLTLVAWRKDQLSMIQIWNGQFKFWDMFLLNFIKIHLFTNEIVISNSGTYVALIHIHLFSCMQLLWNAEFAIAKFMTLFGMDSGGSGSLWHLTVHHCRGTVHQNRFSLPSHWHNRSSRGQFFWLLQLWLLCATIGTTVPEPEPARARPKRPYISMACTDTILAMKSLTTLFSDPWHSTFCL